MNAKLTRKTLVILSVLTLFMGKVNAQENKIEQPNEVSSINKINVNLIGLTFEREQKVGKTTAISFGGGGLGSLYYNFEWTYNSTTGQFALHDDTEFKFFPVIFSGLKHYYNFENRIKKGKKTGNNSANYVGTEVMAIFPRLIEPDFNNNFQLNITPQWGIQRQIAKKVNFELALGPAFRITSEKQDISGYAKIAFGFIL